MKKFFMLFVFVAVIHYEICAQSRGQRPAKNMCGECCPPAVEMHHIEAPQTIRLNQDAQIIATNVVNFLMNTIEAASADEDEKKQHAALSSALFSLASLIQYIMFADATRMISKDDFMRHLVELLNDQDLQELIYRSITQRCSPLIKILREQRNKGRIFH